MTGPEPIEQRLQRIEARLADHDRRSAIAAVLTGYARALDWLDVGLLDEVFASDATVDYGFFRGSWAEFRPMLIEMERSFGRRWHVSVQSDMRFDDEGAWVTSCNFALSAPGTGQNGAADEISGFCGYYVDRFVETASGWRIASRKHLLLTAASWTETAPAGA
ncbi:MAG: nuclear transport factor 2 family protein, partial [Novosphingobium sp.]